MSFSLKADCKFSITKSTPEMRWIAWELAKLIACALKSLDVCRAEEIVVHEANVLVVLENHTVGNNFVGVSQIGIGRLVVVHV